MSIDLSILVGIAVVTIYFLRIKKEDSKNLACVKAAYFGWFFSHILAFVLITHYEFYPAFVFSIPVAISSFFGMRECYQKKPAMMLVVMLLSAFFLTALAVLIQTALYSGSIREFFWMLSEGFFFIFGVPFYGSIGAAFALAMAGILYFRKHTNRIVPLLLPIFLIFVLLTGQPLKVTVDSVDSIDYLALVNEGKAVVDRMPGYEDPDTVLATITIKNKNPFWYKLYKLPNIQVLGYDSDDEKTLFTVSSVFTDKGEFMDSDFGGYSQICRCLRVSTGEERIINVDAFLGIPENEDVDQIWIVHGSQVFKIDIARP